VRLLSRLKAEARRRKRAIPDRRDYPGPFAIAHPPRRARSIPSTASTLCASDAFVSGAFCAVPPAGEPEPGE